MNPTREASHLALRWSAACFLIYYLRQKEHMDRNCRILLLSAVIGLPSTGGDKTTPAAPGDSRLNLLLIVADDLGYADLGAYGGDIRTPNLDALAAGGLLSRSFTPPRCGAPTRAMLLSGNNNHVAGMGQQGAGKQLRAIAGYEEHLSDRIAPRPAAARRRRLPHLHCRQVAPGHGGGVQSEGSRLRAFVHLLEGAGKSLYGRRVRGGRLPLS